MNAQRLSAGDFGAFFAAVNKRPGQPPPSPFRWQQRLVSEVASAGTWPSLLDLPTGSGKTAAIDAAIFLQALLPDAPRRIVYLVDRRIIVQQAADRARTIAAFLAAGLSGGDKVVAAVAQSLRNRTADLPVGGSPAPPLVVAELRGGIARDEGWAARPDLPAVIVSTVDQVGSRLLFRGYGISRRLRPVHAGLLANDALFLLDEVHLSVAFEETLRAIEATGSVIGPIGPPRRWQIVSMSATAGAWPASRVFRLEEPERREPAIAARIGAAKPVRWETVNVPANTSESAQVRPLAERAADRADELLSKGFCTVGVILNRVASAVDAAMRLGDRGHEVVLLTGRMRPLDRERVQAEALPRLVAGRTRDPGDRPVVLVGTQTLEVGVDIDLDVLVTECASLDALRQRFGRVNRLGALQGPPPTSVVLGLSAKTADGSDDPVYGGALAATWRWGCEAVTDFGVEAIERVLPPPAELERLLAPRVSAPVLLPTYLDRWVQTNPEPHADPDVAPWLHGLRDHVETEVQVVWRADITDADLHDWSEDTSEPREQLAALFAAVPPAPGEAMALPLQAVRRWLEGTSPMPVTDVEGSAAGLAARSSEPALHEPRSAVRWSDEGITGVGRGAARLRPGDTLVVPSTYGGIRLGSWDPTSSEAVVDLSEHASRERRRAVLRLLPGDSAERWDPPPPVPTEDPDLDEREQILAWLHEVRVEAGSSDDPVIRHLRRDRRLVVVPSMAGAGHYVVRGSRPLPAAGVPEVSTLDEGEDALSFTGRQVTLQQHLEDVGSWAGRLAEACGLPPQLVHDVALAGRLHDLGKADPRFQSWLLGGIPYSPGSTLLAKSATPSSSQADRDAARRASGYPRGERHEMVSVALATAYPELLESAHDPELVLHLVASHHGWARPFAPVVVDPQPVTASVQINGSTRCVSTNHGLARLDSGVADRFWSVIRRYGWFGATWLECILRLADHRVSEWEQQAGVAT